MIINIYKIKLYNNIIYIKKCIENMVKLYIIYLYKNYIWCRDIERIY